MEHIVLVHGALGDGPQMNLLKENLDNDYRVHVLEFEGHGKTANKKGTFSLDGFVEEFDALLKAIGKEVHVVGYSMGGFVALIAASRGSMGICSLTTLGTKMAWSPAIAEKEVQQLNPTIIAEKVPAFAEVLAARHGQFWVDVVRKTADFMQTLGARNPITKESMGVLSIPVQLCLGDQDRMVSLEETTSVHQWIPGSRLVIVPESKHPLEQVKMEALVDVISTFINFNKE